MAAPKATVKIPIDAMKGSLAKLRRLERPVARRALAWAAEAINSEAQTVSPIRNPPHPVFGSGTLKESHTPDHSNPDKVRIGATVIYAAAVHARHPTNKEWYLKAIVEHGPSIMNKSIAKAIRESKP